MTNQLNADAIVRHVDSLKDRTDFARSEAIRYSNLAVNDPEYAAQAELWCNKEEVAQAEENRAIEMAWAAGVHVHNGSQRGVAF